MDHAIFSFPHGCRSAMRTNSRTILRCAAVVLCVLMITAGLGARPAQASSIAPQFSVLYSFAGLNFETGDGSSFPNSLLVDRNGALYGTATSVGCSLVFKLTPPLPPATQWKKTDLTAFSDPEGHCYSILDAADSNGAVYGLYGTYGGTGLPFELFQIAPSTPPGSINAILSDQSVYGNLTALGLISDPSGTVYVSELSCYPVCESEFEGTIYQLTPPPGGGTPWIKTLLNTFGPCPLEPIPRACSGTPGNLVLDGSGALYGTTSDGGAAGNGTLFKLTPPPGGGVPWTKTVLYDFAGGSDGAPIDPPLNPDATSVNTGSRMVFGNDGSLYAWAAGGAYGQGRVIKLTPPASGSGSWTETVLYNFEGGSDGGITDGIALDATNAVYAPAAGGAYGKGRVIKLAPPPGGGTPWVETALYSFTGGSDGASPNGTLAYDGSGNLYGAAQSGGNTSNCSGGCGTVFKLAGTGFATAVPFSFFSSKLAIGKRSGYFELLSNVTLGSGAAYLDLPTQAVTIRIGSVSVTIPAGSFVKGSAYGEAGFDGTLGGVSIHAKVWLTGTKQYLVLIKASGAELSGATNPVPVTLTLGPNTGTAPVTAAIL